MRALNPQIKIYIDPVMGDYGEGSTWMRHRQLLSLTVPAAGQRPDAERFELEQLCGRQLSSQEQTQHAAQAC